MSNFEYTKCSNCKIKIITNHLGQSVGLCPDCYKEKKKKDKISYRKDMKKVMSFSNEVNCLFDKIIKNNKILEKMIIKEQQKGKIVKEKLR